MTVKRQSKSPIRQAREQAGISAELLAGHAGINLRTLQRIESGEVNPHRATLRAIDAALETLTAIEAA